MRSRALLSAGVGVWLLWPAADAAAQAPPKRPVTHADYDFWNTATGTKLSPDGKYLAYTFSPAAGDGAVVVRNLASGAEHRIASGGRSAATETAQADPAGAPEPGAAPGPGAGGGAGGGGGPAGGLQFTPDSKRLVFSLAPPRSAVDKAKAEKKTAAETPKPVLAVVDLATGQVTTRIDAVRSFTVVGDGAGFVVYQKEPKPEDRPKGDEAKEQAPMPQPPGGAGRRGGAGGAGGRAKGPRAGGGGPGMGGGAGGGNRAAAVGTELVVRNLADGSETSFADVTEFTVTKDAKQLVYAVGSKAADHNGVYVASLGTAAAAAAKAGPGRYSRLVWSEGQTKLAFFYAEPSAVTSSSSSSTSSEEGGSGSTTGTTTAAATPTPAKLHVFVWERVPVKSLVAANPMGPAAVASAAISTTVAAVTVTPAVEVFGPATPGMKAGWAVADRGGLRFSADGLKLELATAPAASAAAPAEPKGETPPAAPAPTPAGPGGRFGAGGGAAARAGGADPDKVELDIWHWKDDAVQPMQKVRSNADRNKTYNAVVFLDTKQFRHLSDEDTAVTVPGHGDWGLAASDKRFRGQQWLSPNPRDFALLNVRTGEGKPVFQGQEFAVFRSPKGKWLLAFDGKDWHSVAVPDGARANLTAKLGVKFFNEEYDSPSTPPAYGLTGWTPDESCVLLNDQYDVWKVALDGGKAENLTKTGRSQKVRFRPIRVAEPDDAAEDRGIDLTKPMLLSAENLATHDTGFCRLEPGGTPKTLVMAARKFGNPTKATRGDTFVFTASTFYDHPDYYTADRDFKEIRRATDFNPKVRELNWGRAELVHYRSVDGAPLTGMLIKPEDFDPAKKYPMIVYIYERLSQGLHNFTLPRQGTSINPTYYASNGYLVFMPDIVYTTGSPGQSALKCVLPAIQAVVDQGCVNEAAIGIQGHSWGGYQIAYLVTQTNRFKAAAAGAPVSDMVSAYGGIRWGTGLPRQFQYEHTQSRIGATLWQAPMKYIENSPIFMADRVATPLLMLHNDQDDAVPWYQGIEYYLALRRLGKEVYLLNYNGELHGLRKKANQRDYTMRMQQFFDHHLKNAPAPEWMAKGVPYNDRDKEKEQWKKLFAPSKN